MEPGEKETKTLQDIRTLAERIIISEGMDLVDMEFRREGNHWVLRIYIDREGGVNLDNCANISRQISVALDVEDYINRKYLLEVSSPGINRPLVKDSDYRKHIGQKVKLKTVKPIEGRKNFSGLLSNFDKGVVTITTADKKTYNIEKGDIIKTRLDVDIVF